MEKTDLVVSKLDSARRALIEAKTVQETKVVMDLAAAEVYARRQQLGEEAIRYATEIKFDAMRKLGSILKVTPKNEGGRPAETGAQREQVLVPSLKTLGISRHVSSFAQQLAIVPQEEFDRAKRGSNPRQRLNALIRKAERRERIERVDIEEAETIAGLKGDEVVALLRE